MRARLELAPGDVCYAATTTNAAMMVLLVMAVSADGSNVWVASGWDIWERSALYGDFWTKAHLEGADTTSGT